MVYGNVQCWGHRHDAVVDGVVIAEQEVEHSVVLKTWRYEKRGRCER